MRARLFIAVVICGLLPTPLSLAPLSLAIAQDRVPDLQTPAAVDGEPAPGRRVRQSDPAWEDSDVYHLLYLPADWKPGGLYPVIVEYAGNQWRTSPGTVEGSNLGYGISGGRGVIWICMPYVNTTDRKNQLTWWGDVDATVAYCRRTVDRICRDYGGDRDNVFIAGFSRGAIGCNFLGLHDNEIAALWRGFICHSHYDGVRRWNYPGSDRRSAAERLRRLGDRPQFISHEGSTKGVEEYLREAAPDGNFTFQPLPGWTHTDTWVLYDVPERRALRKWFAGAIEPRARENR